MKRASIRVDEEQARLLRHLAEAEGRSIADVVREALANYLLRRTETRATRIVEPRRLAPNDEWRAAFAAAVERLRAGVAADASPESIEAEIGAARGEVRRERAARRAPHA